MAEPKTIQWLHYISIGLGVVSAGIIIKTYFDNRDHYKTQREISAMQKELLTYQLKEERENHNFEEGIKKEKVTSQLKDFSNFRNFKEANNFSYTI